MILRNEPYYDIQLIATVCLIFSSVSSVLKPYVLVRFNNHPMFLSSNVDMDLRYRSWSPEHVHARSLGFL